MGETLPVILLGLVILVSLVSMFMSHKTWPIYTIMLLFFNVVAAGGFVYLAARTLKTYDVWRTEVAAWEKTSKKKATKSKRKSRVTKIAKTSMPSA